LADREGWIAACSIALLQAAAFFRWWTATRQQPTLAMLPHLMFAPYGRIAVLHVTVIVSGILVGMLKQPMLGALLLVALKLAFDFGALSTTTVAGKRPSQLLPIRRFITSQEEDARRS
ncbi:MAG: DUF6498-containing protein, partial [Burkholderiaceae bacterium]